MLVRHFQQKIMLAGKHFLNDGFEGAVMPDHFDFDRHAVVEIETALLVDPGGALADHTLPHRRSFVRREQGRHFVREVINGQEGFDAPAVPFYRAHGAAQCRLIVLIGVNSHQKILILRHRASLQLKSTVC